MARLALLPFAAAVMAILPSGCSKAPENASAGASSAGYTLIEQFMSRSTDLVDMDGKVVHRWTSKYDLGSGAQVLPNGDLLRCGVLEDSSFTDFAPGVTGVVERFDWDGNRLWSFIHAEPRRMLHHDFAVLPNGNILLTGLEIKTAAEQIAAGRDPVAARDNALWVDYLIEVKPTGPYGGEVVWRWDVWDHIVQDQDPSKRNHGVISEHPELIDVNFIEEPVPITGSRLKLLQSIGYVAGKKGPLPAEASVPAWTHVNAVSYNAELDQIMLTSRSLGEIWIIDHGTTKEESAGHSGGKYGHGGDLLYRWGNPQAYQRGKPADEKLFGPHNGHWIAQGLPGADNVLIFNNGDGRRDGAYSSIEEIRLPVSKAGSYQIEKGKAYGPDGFAWHYVAQPPTEFFSAFMSGAQRLSNGDTLICSGVQREIIQVDQAKQTISRHRVAENSPEGPPAPGGSRGVPAGGPPPLPDAPPGGGGKPIPALITSLDINGDGVIDSEELLQAMASLKKLDKNRDGVLSIEECLPKPPDMPGNFSRAEGPLGGTGGRPPLPPVFLVLDPNGDGSIDAAELAQAAAALKKLDVNGDDKLSLDECLPLPRGASEPPGGPGGRPGGPGGPSGGLIRAGHYGLDYPAFKGRKLAPLGGSQPSSQPNRYW